MTLYRVSRHTPQDLMVFDDTPLSHTHTHTQTHQLFFRPKASSTAALRLGGEGSRWPGLGDGM